MKNFTHSFLTSKILTGLGFTAAAYAVTLCIGTLASAQSPPANQAQCQSSQSNEDGRWQKDPSDKFSQGAINFQKTKDTLLKNYFNDKITEDDLYEAATQGMLENISHQKWDRLLSPSEYSALKDDLKGEVTGIGIGLKFNDETGHANVIDVISGTPAEKAGIEIGDEILKVNGKSFKGKPFRDMVYTIRGKEGENVELKILRGDRIFAKDMHRERVKWTPTHGSIVAPQVGLVNIDYFVGTIPELTRTALQEVQRQGANDIILDLRGNQGGMLDAMLETASLFMPEGSTIVEATHRGGRKEPLKTKGEPVFKHARLIVLVNGETSSSAEILAGALKDNLGARIVGQKTMGKWNAQSIDDLPNGYAFKYTVSTFTTPRGAALNGKGLEPDVPVELTAGTTPAQLAYIKNMPERIAADSQLRTAISLLK